MGHWDGLVSRPAAADSFDGSLLSGHFAEDAANVNQQLHVILPAYSGEQLWGPAPWMTRVDNSGNPVLPNKGDQCVVVLADGDDEGTPDIWIVAWWPGG